MAKRHVFDREAAEAGTKAKVEGCHQMLQKLSAQITGAESISSPQRAQPDHDADEYSPTANAGGDDPWEAAAAEAAHPTQPEEATAPWPASPAVASPALGTGGRAPTRDPRASLGQQQQPPLPSSPASPAHDNRQPDSGAAALAAQLAAGGDSATRLRQILASLPMEQQQAISAGLAGFVQPEHQDGLEEQHAGAGNDEYDPEDADMQLGF